MKILYISYGKKEVLYQTYISIVSYMSVHNIQKSEDIILYTDNLEYFADIDICKIYISQEKINEFIDNKWVHRAKIKIIQDCMNIYSDYILYLDSDTLWIKKLEISENNIYMHINESQIKYWSRFSSVRDELQKIIPNFEDINFRNAGVVWLPYLCYNLLDEVVSANDLIYNISNWKTNDSRLSEQLAFSYVFQNNSININPLFEYIWHYRPQKYAMWNEKMFIKIWEKLWLDVNYENPNFEYMLNVIKKYNFGVVNCQNITVFSKNP